ncbi:MAG: glycosyltransferase [Deltaproteobacteria bacterium]|nr:glycosyltransferase [Deltaproteobacteria bacterium]MBW2445583.1 glycosyltransferase [Deltaproteobacteria bacterium]
MGSRAVRHTIVCLSSQSWHDGMWTNKQHIMSRLAKEHRVLHVNFGPRPLRDLRRLKAWQGLVDLSVPDIALAPSLDEANGVTLLDFWAPIRGLGRLSPGHPLRRYATHDLRLALLGRFLRREGIDDAILWVYHPGYGAGVARLPHRLIVYDCVDEYSEFPEYRDDPAWLCEREAALCREADLVFTTSRSLHEAKRGFQPSDTYYIPNVGDAEHFASALDPDLEIPTDLRALPRPVFGFVGAVSDYKLDVEWVLELARQRPDASIVLIGPAGIGQPDTDLGRLDNAPNVHLLGHRPYAELPAYVKGFDVCLLPYRRNAYTASCFPIKFFEYLASGRPIVMSPLPALAEHFDAVHVADDAAGFARACEVALRAPEKGRQERLSLARRNTWGHRIEAIRAQIEAKLTPNAPTP